MTQDELKQAVAKAAFDYVESKLEDDMILGVGTGSTANFFIEELGKISDRLEGTVASSEETARRLKSHNIPVFDLNSAGQIAIYVDGADESNAHLQLIKGGGARLNDEVVRDEMREVTPADLDANGVAKLSAGRKRHALVRAV